LRRRGNPARCRPVSTFNITLPPGEFAAYVFDCDGTLADTMPTHFRAWQAALGEARDAFPEALFYELGGTPPKEIAQLLNKRHGLNLPVDDLVARKEALFLEYASNVAAIEPVVAIAREVAGRKPLAVASGGHRNVVITTLRGLGILELFQAVIGAEDYARGKPAPDPFLEAARRLGVSPEQCLVFEDTANGVAAARAAGMQYVLVPAPTRAAVS
jgi:HAD superfamily hydrolase (TIGR01509 family)